MQRKKTMLGHILLAAQMNFMFCVIRKYSTKANNSLNNTSTNFLVTTFAEKAH